MGLILLQERLPQRWLCHAGPRALGWHQGQGSYAGLGQALALGAVLPGLWGVGVVGLG